MNLIIPENYDPVLSLRQTQEAIKYIRDTFQKEFGSWLNHIFLWKSASFCMQRMSPYMGWRNSIYSAWRYSLSAFFP